MVKTHIDSWRMLDSVDVTNIEIRLLFWGLFKIFSYCRLVLQVFMLKFKWTHNWMMFSGVLFGRERKSDLHIDTKTNIAPSFSLSVPLQFLTLYWRALLENGHSLMPLNPMIGYSALQAINWVFEKGRGDASSFILVSGQRQRLVHFASKLRGFRGEMRRDFAPAGRVVVASLQDLYLF